MQTFGLLRQFRPGDSGTVQHWWTTLNDPTPSSRPPALFTILLSAKRSSSLLSGRRLHLLRIGTVGWSIRDSVLDWRTAESAYGNSYPLDSHRRSLNGITRTHPSENKSSWERYSGCCGNSVLATLDSARDSVKRRAKLNLGLRQRFSPRSVRHRVSASVLRPYPL